jgi:Ser/Thr protein kinase RdoA (MazF antagonist)
MDLIEIIGQFFSTNSLGETVPFGRGHINDTYVVSFRQPDGAKCRYILQRINRFVFKDPEALMENVERVTRHLHSKIAAAGGDPLRETLNLVPTLDGRSFFRDPGGEYWRVFHFIEGARTYESAESPQQIYQAAWAFGNFQRQLADFPAGQLHETIPFFHDTPRRFHAFKEAVQRDTHQRAETVRAEIHFLEQRAADTRVLVDGIARGVLPLRVTHNDTKFNNVMIDDRTNQAVCILDLDTVMPGLALYDFGDAVRSSAALAEEDEPNSSKAGISLEIFDSLAHGYLDVARGFLREAELNALAFSARLITLEQAIRFLGDYLNGDIYYKIHRPDHNLDRARTQIGMLRDMEEKSEQMEAIISKYR